MNLTLHNLEGYTGAHPLDNYRMTPMELSQCFQLVIPFPKESDPEFGQIESIVSMGGGYMATIIADYILMSPQDRANENLLVYRVTDSIVAEIQSIIDGIETTWNEDLNNFIADDPNDNYLLQVAESMLYGGGENPLSVWNIANRLVPLLRIYYANIFIDEEIDIWAEWDYEFHMINDNTAVIFFKEPNTINLIKRQFGLV